MSTLQDPTDDSSLVVIGGHDKINGKTSDAILKLTCTAEEDCKWQVLNHKLQFPRWGHVAFFTNKPVNCTQIS